jgi:hypothetical protein
MDIGPSGRSDHPMVMSASGPVYCVPQAQHTVSSLAPPPDLRAPVSTTDRCAGCFVPPHTWYSNTHARVHAQLAQD